LVCRLKNSFDYTIASEETANKILDRLGFGEKRCAQISETDGRYGVYNHSGIKFGFKNGTDDTIPFGKYVVFNYWLDYGDGYIVCNKREFDNMFEECA